MRHVGLFAIGLVVSGCAAASTAPSSDESSTASSARASSDVELAFRADFTQSPSGALVVGGHARVVYDVSRLTACRGDLAGGPGWSITGHYRIAGGAVGSFEAGGLSPSHGTSAPILALTAPGDLEVWFENTSAWGCQGWDSNFGRNYHFTIAPSPDAPGWVGNASYVIARGTCSGAPCDADIHPLAPSFTFDTWARQRAAFTEALFEVWKTGVTDFDNPDLWKQLDVELHTRIGDSGAFVTSYVGFDRRLGNNARYAVQLRALDPLSAGSALANKSDCPKFPTTVSADGQYVQADVQLYFTVNGVELRPSGGGVFHGLYSNYRGLYSICGL